MRKTVAWLAPWVALSLVVVACDDDSGDDDPGAGDSGPSQQDGGGSSSGEASDGGGSSSGEPSDSGATGDADVPPFTEAQLQLAVSNFGVCALKQNGTVWCWGNNDQLSLGNGIDAVGQRYFPEPQPVVGPDGEGVLDQVTSIAAGGAFVCAGRSDGSAFCWGSTGNSALGNDVYSGRSPVPVQVLRGDGGPLLEVREVFAGADSACAIVGNERTAYCWGNNDFGKLGMGSVGLPAPAAGIGDEEGNVPSVALSARPVLNFDGSARMTAVDSISIGVTVACFSSGAIWNGYSEGLGPGAVWCAGTNLHDQLGVGSPPARPLVSGYVAAVRTPRGNAWLADVGRLASGADHTCTLWSGHVTCWGSGASPRGQVGGLPGEEAPVGGWAWSRPGVTPLPGQLLALGQDGERDRPTGRVVANHGVTCAVVDVVDNNSGEVLSRGEMRCMGTAAQGALGNGSSTGYASAFTKVVGEGWDNNDAVLTGVRTAAAGSGSNTCAIVEDGRILCWGQGYGYLMGPHDPNAQTFASKPTPVEKADGTPFNIFD